jgi:hypothetical protein
MKKIIFIILMLVLHVFYSCKKSATENNVQSCRMVSSIGNMQNSFYYYNENKSISKIMFINPPDDTSWQNYYYENGHVSYMIRLYKGTLGDTILYTYNSGKYTEINEYGFTLKYYYDNSGYLSKIEKYENHNLSGYSKYTFNSNGDCIKFLQYYVNGANTQLDGIVDFEYGNTRSPYSSTGMPPINSQEPSVGQYLSTHMLIKMRYTWPGQEKIVLLYTSGTLNNNGYPKSITISDSLINVISTNNFEYSCP